MTLKSQFASWWFARDARLRKIVNGALLLLSAFLAFCFLSFSSNWATRGDNGTSTSDATFTLGSPTPWFHWEKHEERIKKSDGASSSSSMNFRSESNFDFWSRSFGAGVACLLCLSLRGWLVRCEKTVQ